MVIGFESFREHFRGYEDCYTIIGGTACDILMSEAALPFRATKDVDMILLIENRFDEFAGVFWSYIKSGGYRCGWRNSEIPHFYRFTEPQIPGYPVMIELFSRRPDFQLDESVNLTPLPTSDEVSSLSAIMLDDNYYNLMLEGRKTVDGISVMQAEYLTVFKAKAWLDLSQKKSQGIHVNDRDLRKHKGDVFRLFAIIDPTVRIELNDSVKDEMRSFLSAMEQENINLRDIGVSSFTISEALDGLRTLFSITE